MSDASSLVSEELRKAALTPASCRATDLVVHQRDQRRDHDGDAVACALACNGRDLVAQRFAPASGHEHQCIAPGGHMVDDGLLRARKAS